MSVEARIAALEARVAKLEHASGGAIAPDSDLDSEWGNPEVRKDPPRWKGDSHAGSRMSECPADYLRSLAGLYDWQADQDEKSNRVDGKGRPTAPYRRKDAARARGWAKRNEGKPSVKKAAQRDFADAQDEEMPF